MSDVERNWIHTSTGESPPEDDFLFVPEPAETPGRRALLKSVRMSWPVLSLGFVSVIFLSLVATYLSIKLFPDTLELAPNGDVLRLEASVATEVRPQLNHFRASETMSVAGPYADLNTDDMAGGQDFAGLDDSLTQMAEIKIFSGSQVTSIKVPVAKLSFASYLDEGVMSRERSLRHDATPLSLVPDERSFTAALGIANPIAIIDLPARTASFRGLMEGPSQKLLPKRYAFAVSDPVIDMRATEASSDFSDAIMGAESTKLLSLKERDFNSMQVRQEVPAQKLLPKRYAFAVSNPVIDMRATEAFSDFSDAIMGAESTKLLSLKERSFTAALGIADPIATIDLSARTLSFKGLMEAPSQMLLPKRYAKLVDAPVLREDDPVIMALPKPSPVLRVVVPTTSKPAKQNLAAWRKYAAKVPAGAEGKPKIVIIIDDMGNNARMAERLGDIEGPLNFAFLPYAPGVKSQTMSLREKGHELLVHMPMEPTGSEYPGPNALKVDLPARDLQAMIEWNLTRFDGYVGINNHMGSRFTKDGTAMALVMSALKERGLLFLDSVTTGSSKGADLAQQMGLPWAGRDVFLDNEVNEAAIGAQLMKVERIAERKGLAIAIGHPHGATYRALKAWIPTLEDKGFVLVPVSSIAQFQGERRLAVGFEPELASD